MKLLVWDRLGRWVAASADLVSPLREALKQEALESGYLQADETPIAVQDSGKSGSTHRGYYWAYHEPLKKAVVMDYQPGRSRDGPKAMLGSYRGLLQSDGYTVYDEFDRMPGIIACGCWAHARRYFFEAKESAPQEAEHVLREIGLLYEVERAPAETDPSPENRQAVRRKESWTPW